MVEEAVDLIRTYATPPRKYHLAVELIESLDVTTRSAVLSVLQGMENENIYFRVLVNKFHRYI